MKSPNIAAWLPNNGRILQPPGCEKVFATRPGTGGGCCAVGIVHEHRFAFCFWAEYARKNRQPPPVLLTLDSHNDVGGPCDIPSTSDLKRLPLADSRVVCLYAWLQLRALNDGHIFPALHMGFFSDVYVLLSKKVLPCNGFPCHDKEGNRRCVHFFNHERDIVDALPDNQEVYLDIDLDFFARGNNESGRCPRSAVPWPPEEIRRFLRRKTGLIQRVLPRVVGMTIALEPRYCGGFVNSLRILEAVNRELFGGTLGTRKTKWRNAKR